MAAVKKIDVGLLVLKILFACVAGFSLIIGVVMSHSVKTITNINGMRIEYINNWTVMGEDGESFETGRSLVDNRAYSETFTMRARLPRHLGHDSVLCFINRSSFEVYIGGELRKSFDRDHDTGIPGGSMKEFYVTVPLSIYDEGAVVTIVRSPTDWNPVVVPETFVTTAEGVYEYAVHKHGLPFALAAILFVASFIVTLIGLVYRIWKRETIEVMYAAVGILDVACWLIAVSQITPLITRIYFVDGLMGYLFCLMMPFGLLIYLDSIQKGRYRILNRVLFSLSLFSFVLWTTLHFTGLVPFQSSLVFIDAVLGASVVCMLVTLIIDVIKGYAKEYRYTSIGFLMFMILALVQIIVLIFFQKMNNELPVLIGLFTLLILVSVQQIYDIRRTRTRLENALLKKGRENEQMLIHIVQTLAGTIDAKDRYTDGHSSRVADYSREIAKRYGYKSNALSDIYMMGLLHDIGKIGIPDAVINKPTKLDDDEYALIKKHPEMGARILQNITEKKALAIGARSHHERYDGKGYPDGLKGNAIPEQARIIAVADAYDAMTSYRSYRDPLPQEKVVCEMEKGKGTQFDPRFADIMIKMIGEDTEYRLREHK